MKDSYKITVPEGMALHVVIDGLTANTAEDERFTPSGYQCHRCGTVWTSGDCPTCAREHTQIALRKIEEFRKVLHADPHLRDGISEFENWLQQDK